MRGLSSVLRPAEEVLPSCLPALSLVRPVPIRLCTAETRPLLLLLLLLQGVVGSTPWNALVFITLYLQAGGGGGGGGGGRLVECELACVPPSLLPPEAEQ